jgi:PAS domain S-box-containing protein
MIRPPSILVVDDLPGSRELLCDMLDGHGYELLSAAGGAEALAIARARCPDLILLDVMMPDIDGFQVCRELRADPHTAHVPVIIVTALDDRKSRLAGLAAGCDDFITKPVDMLELRARARTIVTLNRYRLLLDEQQRFERLFDLSPNGLAIVDDRGAIRLANRALVRLAAVDTPAALDGLALADLLGADERERCAGWLAALIHDRCGEAQLSAQLVARDGRRRPVELDAGWFEWAGAPALQVVIRDVSDRKRAELLEEDRRRLAFDLHDDVAQTATAAYRQLERLRHRYRPRRPEARAELDRALELVRRLMRETRNLLAGLRPTALDDFGLAVALQMHCAALAADGLAVAYHENLGPVRLDAAVETALFRIAQEALTNVRKHAGTDRAAVSLLREGGCIQLTILDEGRGLTLGDGPAPGGTRIGVRAMQERAALLGGSLRVESGPGAGTRVVASVPLPTQDKDPYA